MRLPQQPKYEVSISHPDKSKTVDVTAYVIGDVVLEEKCDSFATLTFRLTNADILMYDVLQTYIVDFSGGSFDPDNKVSGDRNYRNFFHGRIMHLTVLFPDSGMVELQCFCIANENGDATSTKDTFYYPTDESSHKPKKTVTSHTSADLQNLIAVDKSKRSWAIQKEITLSKLVENLILEMGFKVGKIADEAGNLTKPGIEVGKEHTFTTKRPICQNNVTDWGFLRSLAKRFNCTVWSEYQDGGHVVLFVDNNKIHQGLSTVIFVYPERTDEGKFKLPELNDSQQLIWNVSVQTDTQSMYALARVVTRWASDKNEALALFEVYDPDLKKYFLYELDTQKAQEFSDKNGVAELSRFAWNATYEEILSFFKKKEVTHKYDQEDFTRPNRPMRGETLEFSAEGNVNVKVNQLYRVYGLYKYSTDDNNTHFLSSTWRMYELQHSWGSRGYEIRTKFMR